MKQGWKVLLIVLATLAVTPWASRAAGALTPEGLKGIIDANAMLLMVVGGFIIKFVPKLSGLSNQFIGWINVIVYGITKLLVPDAHAGVLDAVPDAVGVLVGGITNAIGARQLYELLFRPLLERVLKLKKYAVVNGAVVAVPPGGAPTQDKIKFLASIR